MVTPPPYPTVGDVPKGNAPAAHFMRWVKVPAEVLEWSLAPGSGGLSGLPTDEKQPEGGLQRVDRFIHHVQSLHLLWVQPLDMVENSIGTLRTHFGWFLHMR